MDWIREQGEPLINVVAERQEPHSVVITRCFSYNEIQGMERYPLLQREVTFKYTCIDKERRLDFGKHVYYHEFAIGDAKKRQKLTTYPIFDQGLSLSVKLTKQDQILADKEAKAYCDYLFTFGKRVIDLLFSIPQENDLIGG
jgi:hypothetical protein